MSVSALNDSWQSVQRVCAIAATGLAIGAFASGVAAAMTLAFVMTLDRGYLTVAFAVTALTTSVTPGPAVTMATPILPVVRA